MAAEPHSVQFSIGRAIGDSFGVHGRNCIAFTALALAIGLRAEKEGTDLNAITSIFD